MQPFRKTFHLPVVFRPLDIEEFTKPQGVVLCPVRNEPVTLGTCGHCDDFARVEFDARSKPHVCCTPCFPHRPRGLSSARGFVKEVLRVPLLSASEGTPVSVFIPYVDLQRPWDAIPVLDRQARPIGVVSNETLRKVVEIDHDRAIESVMSVDFARVFPWQSVAEAAAARPETAFRGVVVIAGDGTFLGMVCETDLPEAA